MTISYGTLHTDPNGVFSVAYRSHTRRPGTMSTVKAQLNTWRDRVRNRAELFALAEGQPDGVLQDVGLTRSEAYAEARKPFWRA